MKTRTTFFKILSKTIGLGVIASFMVSCGSYVESSYNDGIYGDIPTRIDQEREITQEDVYNENSSNYYQQLFAIEAAQYPNTATDDQIFTDVDSYSSDDYDQQMVDYSLDYSAQPAWGTNPSETIINYYNVGGFNQFGFANRWGFGGPWGFGFNNWGYGPWGFNNFGFGGPWGFNNFAFGGFGFGFGFGYNAPFFNGGFGFHPWGGYGFNNWGNNYYFNNNIAYGRYRGSNRYRGFTTNTAVANNSRSISTRRASVPSSNREARAGRSSTTRRGTSNTIRRSSYPTSRTARSTTSRSATSRSSYPTARSSSFPSRSSSSAGRSSSSGRSSGTVTRSSSSRGSSGGGRSGGGGRSSGGRSGGRG